MNNDKNEKTKNPELAHTERLLVASFVDGIPDSETVLARYSAHLRAWAAGETSLARPEPLPFVPEVLAKAGPAGERIHAAMNKAAELEGHTSKSKAAIALDLERTTAQRMLDRLKLGKVHKVSIQELHKLEREELVETFLIGIRAYPRSRFSGAMYQLTGKISGFDTHWSELLAAHEGALDRLLGSLRPAGVSEDARLLRLADPAGGAHPQKEYDPWAETRAWFLSMGAANLCAFIDAPMRTLLRLSLEAETSDLARKGSLAFKPELLESEWQEVELYTSEAQWYRDALASESGDIEAMIRVSGNLYHGAQRISEAQESFPLLWADALWRCTPPARIALLRPGGPTQVVFRAMLAEMMKRKGCPMVDPNTES